MKNKRSIGVTIFSILSILFGLNYLLGWTSLNQAMDLIVLLALGALFAVSGVFMLTLRKWARITFLASMAIQSLMYLYLGVDSWTTNSFIMNFAVLYIGIFPFSLSFSFFKQPKIKEQFV